jgi:hypothetical protein
MFHEKCEGVLCGCCRLPTSRELTCMFLDDGERVLALHRDCFFAWRIAAIELQHELNTGRRERA